MFKYLLCVFSVALLATSCLKNDTKTGCPYTNNAINVPQAELDSITAYLDSNDLTATKHPTGFYYNIVEPGASPDSVRLCSQIQIDYKGQLKSGTVFDQQTNMVFVLGSLIPGWKYGIPLIKKAGKIKLYIPPSLGYGSNPVRDNNNMIVIPANSMLIFDVTLKDYTAGN
jgi:FKBP-type peptidyl-prolyl cis-trans isomerase FkpA